MSDFNEEELRLLLSAPEDSVKKQRARAGTPKGRPANDDITHLESLLEAEHGGGGVPRETPASAPPATTAHPPDKRMEGWDDEPMHEHVPQSHEPGAPVPGRESAAMLLGMLIGEPVTKGVSRVIGRGPIRDVAANVTGGGVAGGVQAAAAGGTPGDVAKGAFLGGAVSGIGNVMGMAAHPPRTQAEIDASVIKQYRMQHPDPVIDQAMQGTHETHRLAREANDLLNARVGDRAAANGKLLDTADADFSMLDAEYPIPDTSHAIDRIQGIREQTYGGQGPQFSSDPILADAQRQLTIGKSQTQMVPRDVLRSVQRKLNEEADFQSPKSDIAGGALRQGAGVVSDTARTADPRLGPGNLGGALDKFGYEKDALSNIDELRGPEAGRVPKLARVGGGDQMADPAVHQAESQVRDLQAAEPAANSLIDRIRYNNTVGRRSLRLPYISYSPTATAARGIKQNFDNLKFHLAPPAIDEAGNVAGREARNVSPLLFPLELEMIDQLQHRNRENRR